MINGDDYGLIVWLRVSFSCIFIFQITLSYYIVATKYVLRYWKLSNQFTAQSIKIACVSVQVVVMFPHCSENCKFFCFRKRNSGEIKLSHWNIYTRFHFWHFNLIAVIALIILSEMRFFGQFLFILLFMMDNNSLLLGTKNADMLPD